MDRENTPLAEVALYDTQQELSRVTARCMEAELELELLRRYLRGLNINPTVNYLKEIYGE